MKCFLIRLPNNSLSRKVAEMYKQANIFDIKLDVFDIDGYQAEEIFKKDKIKISKIS